MCGQIAWWCWSADHPWVPSQPHRSQFAKQKLKCWRSWFAYILRNKTAISQEKPSVFEQSGHHKTSGKYLNPILSSILCLIRELEEWEVVSSRPWAWRELLKSLWLAARVCLNKMELNFNQNRKKKVIAAAVTPTKTSTSYIKAWPMGESQTLMSRRCPRWCPSSKGQTLGWLWLWIQATLDKTSKNWSQPLERLITRIWMGTRARKHP